MSQVPPGGWDRPVGGPPPLTAPFASWGSRVGAAVVDALLISAPAVLIAVVVFGGIVGSVDDESSAFVGVLLAGLAALLCLVIAGLLYAPVLMRREGEHNGQTWGKQLFGIRVVRVNAAPMDFTSAALREVVIKGIGLGLMSTFIPLAPYVFDALWPLWDDERRALHDIVASTRVVEA